MKQKTVWMAVAALALLWVASPQFALADDAPGGQGFFNGTGNSDGDFTVAGNASIAIGLRGADRFVGPITPSGDDYTCSAGTPAEQCNYEFSVAILDPTLSLADFTYLLTVQDLTSGKSVSYDPVAPGLNDDSYSGSSGKTTATIGIDSSSNLSSESIFQNSEYLGFAFLGLNWNSADQVIVSLSATPTSANPSLSGTTAEIGFNTAVPEPSAALLGIVFLGAVGFVALWRRRREA